MSKMIDSRGRTRVAEMVDTEPALRGFDVLQAGVGNVGWYQLRVLLATQLGYLSVTGSMLCTIFDNLKPDGLNCSLPDQGGWRLRLHNGSGPGAIGFHSLLADLGLVCGHKYLPTLLSSMVMIGGVLGASVWGFLADRFGRKWATTVPLAGVLLLNLAVAALAHFHLALTAILFFCLGFFGGGYMVTNIVTMLEVMGGQLWRLGATSLNGWPAGLMLMAGIAAGTRYWRYYHLTLAAIALPLLLVFIFFILESPRWLIQHRRFAEAHQILEKIAAINGTTPPSLALVQQAAEVTVAEAAQHRRYSYIDLVRHRSVLIPLCALTYSWLASSIISFGIYFSLGKLSKSLYLNTVLTGLIKGCTGVIPFLVARWVGRKPILLIAASIACLSSWAAVLIYALHPSPKGSSWLIACAIIGAASVDPIWKINHLYSTELFPTVVRNMARAVCNVGSRLGSVIGPQVAFLGSLYGPGPAIVFGVLSLLHVLSAAIILPETKGRPLPDALPSATVFPVSALPNFPSNNQSSRQSTV